MTLDDLYAAYTEAYGNSLRFLMVDGAAEDRAHRAGIEAVVRSLLPALIQVHWAGYHDALNGVDPNVSSDYCTYKINEILGSDAGAAGTSSGNTEGKTCLVATPANSFCEWASHPPHGNVFRSCIGIVVSLKDAGEMCSWCGKPIKFKEETK